MPSSTTAGGITELNVNVTRRRPAATGLIYDAASRPPKITGIEPSSYFYGALYVGDELLSINGDAVNTAEDFEGIVAGLNVEPGRLRMRIRVRRDTFHTVTEQNLTPADQQQQLQHLEITVRWRNGGNGLGLTASNTDEAQLVVIIKMEEDSIVTGHCKCGDVITHVNGQQIERVAELKTEILKHVNLDHAVALRIERRTTTTTTIAPLPDDVRRIIMEHQGWYNQRHLNAAADDLPPTTPTAAASTGINTATMDTGNSNNQRGGGGLGHRVRITSPTAEDLVRIVADNMDNPLMPTPERVGSQHRNNSSGTDSTRSRKKV